MNQLNTQERARIINCLVEGCSMRSTVRLTGAAKKTVAKLQADIGIACAEHMDKAMVNLPCRRLQVDEIWAFCYAKAKNVPAHLKGKHGVGDVWTWVAIDPDTKLIPVWHVGNRDAGDAYVFIHNIKARLSHRVQMTSDGLKAYLSAVEDAFGSEIDFAQLVKIYGTSIGPNSNSPEVRYSPAQCMGARKTVITGKPEYSHISTSISERANLTMRMGMRRFTRLTNGFSKKVECHKHAVALHFLHYNFARIHQTLRVTPAMEAGISDHVWSIEEIAALLDKPKPKENE